MLLARKRTDSNWEWIKVDLRPEMTPCCLAAPLTLDAVIHIPCSSNMSPEDMELEILAPLPREISRPSGDLLNPIGN
jgi:hypothetical protein